MTGRTTTIGSFPLPAKISSSLLLGRRSLSIRRQPPFLSVIHRRGGAEESNQSSDANSKSTGNKSAPVAENNNVNNNNDPKPWARKGAFLSAFRKSSSSGASSTTTSESSDFFARATAEALTKKLKERVEQLQTTTSKWAPSVVSAVSILWTSKDDSGLSLATLYALTLLGASCGFYLFLYFITVGYALGITLPLAVTLAIRKKQKPLNPATYFHSAITVAWGLRMLTFLLWREYMSWPALHQRVVELQSKMTIPFASHLLCWFVYSFFYTSMMTMTWSRLQQQPAKWGLIGVLGLTLQIFGLGLETIADLQKNGFKSIHRHAWCNIGLWKWSTHPNYLGEGLFWWGTYLAHGFHSPLLSTFATIGLLFIIVILKGSTRSITMKHLEKYGDQSEFCEFQRSHGVWGPKRWWWWLHGMEELSNRDNVSTVSATVVTNTTNTSAVNDPSSALPLT